MAASASQSTSPLTRRKWTMEPSTSYELRRTLSSSSLEAARCAGLGVAASSLEVLELSAASREARPPTTEGESVAGKGVVSPPRMEARRARALSAPWCATVMRGWRGGTPTQLGDTQAVAARQGRRLGGRGQRQLHKRELGGGRRGRRR